MSSDDGKYEDTREIAFTFLFASYQRLKHNGASSTSTSSLLMFLATQHTKLIHKSFAMVVMMLDAKEMSFLEQTCKVLQKQVESIALLVAFDVKKRYLPSPHVSLLDPRPTCVTALSYIEHAIAEAKELESSATMDLLKAVQKNIVRELVQRREALKNDRLSRGCACCSRPFTRQIADMKSLLETQPSIFLCGGGASPETLSSCIEKLTLERTAWGYEARFVANDPMFVARTAFAACYFKGELFCIGGLGSLNFGGGVERFSLLSTKWTSLSRPFPRPQLAGHGSLEFNDKLLVFGGEVRGVKSKELFVLKDHESDSTLAYFELQEASLLVPRSAFGSCVFNGRVVVAGGAGQGDVILSSIELLEDVGDWALAQESLSKPRAALGLFEFEGSLYACGGDLCQDDNKITSIEKRDNSSGKWKIITELVGEQRDGAGISLLGSKVFFLGSCSSPFNKTWNSFCLKTLTWASHCYTVSHRALPREITCASAVCVPPFPVKVTWG